MAEQRQSRNRIELTTRSSSARSAAVAFGRYDASTTRRSPSTSRIQTTDTETTTGVAIQPGHNLVDGDSVWVADWGGPQVVRLRAVGPTKPRSVQLPVTKQFDAGVWNVAMGAGALWATTPREGALWRLDPETNAVTRIAMPYFPTGVAADDDDVWVTVRGE